VILLETESRAIRPSEKEREGFFFVNKKKQENFFVLGYGR
jgi:hypothetical protein